MRDKAPQAIPVDRLGRTRIVDRNGRTRSICGRCGGLASERKNGEQRYCRDCIRVDPVFCNWT